MKDKLGYNTTVEQTQAEVRRKEIEEEEKKISLFYEKINFSTDLNDQLQELANYLKEKSNATAVYIGKLVSPKRKIKEDDDENSHKDEDAAKIIHYINATKGHEFLVDKVLR